jgi:uncharacterized membrane protein
MKRISILLLLLAVAGSAVVYPMLPPRVPIHWNARGEIDGWGSPLLGALLMPLLMIGIVVLFRLLPKISPKEFPIDAATRALAIVETATVAFLLMGHATILLASTGRPVRIDILMPAAIGLLFIILGNYMTKFRRNFFIGIRTPWTLASDEVWLRTHRLGAVTFVAAGVALLVAAPTGYATRLSILLPIILIAAFVPAAYSFVIYRQLNSSGE